VSLASNLAKTALFTLVVPGTVAVIVPRALARAAGPAAAPPLPLAAVALALGAAGAALYLVCAFDFARAAGTPAPIDPPKALVARGPYRFSRNPMYVAVLAVVLAQALWHRSAALAAYAAAVATAFHLFVVLYEEPALARSFGDAYARYRARVPRWVGRPRG
jgi:protein-S-isoprenylcysteine O-methyltransferase Ste14